MTQPYAAPLNDMQFILSELADFDNISRLPGCGDATPDMAFAILEQAGRFAAEVLAPLNRSGDLQGCALEGGCVKTPDGWDRAYRLFIESGWGAVAVPSGYGGQALPKLIAAPLLEMWSAANMAFSLLPLVTASAIEALLASASDDIKRSYLPKMASGSWSGAMDLTEPQAGSDLSQLKASAVAQTDGSYRIFGQKIFISYGEHELSENIVHLVLARLPQAPPGTRGISLFIVPKYLPNADGSPGRRNDVHCVSLEHKMGLRGSPTCVMQYGENGGAVGHLVGVPNRGLEHMFVMMNEARFGTGMQAIGVAERAYQQALGFARERKQGRDAITGENMVPIIRHPDIRRTLLVMKAKIMASRVLAYSVAGLFDQARHEPDPARRAACKGLLDLLTPVVKAWATHVGNEVAFDAVQVHGGMGFVEETGAAQFMRDIRIGTIYEGTTAIQANDLVLRKIVRERGASVEQLIARIERDAADLLASPQLVVLHTQLLRGVASLKVSVAWILNNEAGRPADVLAVAVPFLFLMSYVCGGWQIGRAACAAQRRLDSGGGDLERGYYLGVRTLAEVFLMHVGVQVQALAETVLAGGKAVTEFADEQF